MNPHHDVTIHLQSQKSEAQEAPWNSGAARIARADSGGVLMLDREEFGLLLPNTTAARARHWSR
ncbi:MAG: hypothetical protein KGK16_18040 [Bradyrhizobium sp.]|uniref:hypothetical protein n=1 Tax=Bradyrhizobium sp. TaxID=376 RepID=UPI001ECB0458|nr:hypothetical protein [Bradyrhizobium sp.]MBU6456506.1 hypothetical protein [Bradyrhizobium sp.]MDE2332665.1 hypothetical protein [Bradyrhizobium sp.]MDE2601777.1 hypothetical protein [Bradyrhizobium sp.]